MPNIPQQVDMTPALYGIVQFLDYEVLDRHWGNVVQNLLVYDTQKGMFDQMWVFCLLQSQQQGGRSPGNRRQLSELFCSNWLKRSRPAPDSNESEEVRTKWEAVASAGWCYYDVVQCANGLAAGGAGAGAGLVKPAYDAALQAWRQRYDPDIQAERTRLLNWLSDPALAR